MSEERWCPDGGKCHHKCAPAECFRVQCCGPLSGVYPNDEWPDDVRARFDDVIGCIARLAETEESAKKIEMRGIRRRKET